MIFILCGITNMPSYKVDCNVYYIFCITDKPSFCLIYYLKNENINLKVLEAKNRLGGRIETIYGNLDTPMEMGATWFGKEHTNLKNLY